MRAKGGNDEVSGGAGNDRLFGDRGNDTLNGDAGKDQIKGGSGGDLLNGGKGADVLSGGSGADTFFFKRGDGKDRITDFNIGQDLIEIGKGANKLGKLNFNKQGSDVLVTFANVEILVEDVTLRMLRDADNFEF